jgi:hypothetical protein
MLTEMFTDGYLNKNLQMLQLVNEPRILAQFSPSEQAKLRVRVGLVLSAPNDTGV